MSTDSEAKLFYGYIKPLEVLYSDEDEAEQIRWHNARLEQAHDCIGGVYGDSDYPAHFLAVEEALYITEGEHVFHLISYNLQVKPEWDVQLRQAAEHFGLDLTGMHPGWYLVCLYF